MAETATATATSPIFGNEAFLSDPYGAKLVDTEKVRESEACCWGYHPPSYPPKDYEKDLELQKIREDRGYKYTDMLDLCPEKTENYEAKLKNFYTEHMHADEEIRCCLKGSGYFDVRDKEDRWIRIWMMEGDLMPAGIYHRFTLDTSNYVKLMRLFKGEPVWTASSRPQEDHPARKVYAQIEGIALEAH